MIVKNTLGDLTNHLFAELERLGDEDMDEEALEREIKRAKSMSAVSAQIIASANTMINAMAVKDSLGDADAALPRMLTDGGR